MAFEGRLTGKNIYVEFGGESFGDVRRTLEINEEQEMVDATAGADEYRVMLPTVKTIGATMELLYREKASATAVYGLVTPGQEGTLLWGPEGSATGAPKYGINARISSISRSMAYDDVQTVSIEFANTGGELAFDGSTAVWP